VGFLIHGSQAKILLTFNILINNIGVVFDNLVEEIQNQIDKLLPILNVGLEFLNLEFGDKPLF
jgi:hypothetical protein